MKIRFGFGAMGVLAALAIGAAVPAGASAASATVTGDTGAPMPLGGAVTIRNLDPDIEVTFTDAEKRNLVDVVGPDGRRAIAFTPFCSSSSFKSSAFRYFGNGTYTVIVKTYAEANCDGTATETRLPFNINAFSGVAAPGARLLAREPLEPTRGTFAFKIEVNPGATAHEVRYAAGATVGPDGGLAGVSDRASVDAAGNANVTFFKPGTYTFVARALGFDGSDLSPTAWSAPVVVQVLEPFDFVGPTSFPDSRGPTYKLAGQVREPSATGKITVAIAAGKRGKKFKRLGVAKISRGGKFSLRFKLRKAGFYTLRYTYRGNATVVAGFVKEVIRIRRIVTFGGR